MWKGNSSQAFVATKVLLCLVALLMFAAVAKSADLYHVVVRDHADANLLTAIGADAVLRVRDGYLVLIPPDRQVLLSESELEFELVAADLYREHLALDIRHDNLNRNRYPLIYEDGQVRLFRIDPTSLPTRIPDEYLGLAPILTHNPRIVYKKPPRFDATALRDLMDLDSLISLVIADSCQSYVERLQAFNGRFVGTDSNYASRDWLAAKFVEFGYDSIVIDSFSAPIYEVRTECQNVFACKVGSTYPHHQIVIGAHRDSWPDGAPGADDNGSGTGGVLEIARILQGIETKLTFVFVLFDAEEEGLYGAWDYANKAAFRGDSIVLMVNLDMIAYGEDDTSAFISYTPGNTFAQIWQNLADSLAVINIMADIIGNGAIWDACPFEEQGYYAMTLHEYISLPWVHTQHDSTVYLDFDYMARMVMATLATVYVADGTYLPDPMLLFSFPDNAPILLIPNTPTTFPVTIEGYAGGVVVPGTEQLLYSLNGDTLIPIPLVEVGGGLYEATFPGFPCDSRLSYYVTAQEIGGTTFYGPGQNQPILAGAATNATMAFEDDFQTYQGWSVMGDAEEGLWQRGVPKGGGWYSDPPEDFDGSGICYVTDNDRNIDVDGGTTMLRSPPFDVSNGDAIIRYARWFSNGSSSDVFEVYVSTDGPSWILVETVGPAEQSSRGWFTHEFWVSDFVPPTANVRIRFDASDLGSDSKIEAAVDAVTVTHYWCEPAPLITTGSLPDWTVTIPYSQQLTASGGYGSISWNDKYDDLAGTGLTLSPEGMLSGTPSVTETISFTAVATDDIVRTDEKLLSFQINDLVLVTTETLPDGKQSDSYSYPLVASGGTGSHSWSDRDNDLVGTGLVLGSDGLLSGTPVDSGTISFVARVEDAVSAWDERLLNVYVEVAYICGDIDASGGNPNVADLTYLVEYLFFDGPPPPVLEAANVDGEGGVNVADLIYLVDYLFFEGPELICGPIE